MDEFELLLDRNDLADLLKIPRYKLNYILYVRGVDSFYTSFEIPKKNGGIRQINAPNTSLKYIQRSLVDAIWRHEVFVWGDKISTRNISHAFEKDKSIITNARIHKNKRYIINLDLENFFDSFHFGRVLGFFEKNRDFRLPRKLAAAMAQLVCFNGHLPQGAPSSPIITNLICQILDFKILNLAKKYKLDYTRYADDLTFSTNNKYFASQYEKFVVDIRKLISYSGFNVNELKTRCIYKSSRQEVTGLTVNSKINVAKEFYKETRAMAHHLYKYGEFHIKGQSGSMNQLEGRFAFINHVEQNNLWGKKHKKQFKDFTSKEKEYQKFIFFKSFISNDKPVLVTEGETDIAYIKAALKKHYRAFPALVVKHDVNKFEFSLSFLRRTLRNEYFLSIVKDGADTIKNLYDLYAGKSGKPNLAEFFYKLSGSNPQQPVILMFDNELVNSKKPLRKFLSHIRMNDNDIEILKNDLNIHLLSNLYLFTNNLVKGFQECEIEDLFSDVTLSHEIDGKKFSRDSNADNTKFYSKSRFANFVSDNFEIIDFTGFLPYLTRINALVSSLNEQISNDQENC